MISPSIVITADQRVREVRNLGWLLRHWEGVESFTIAPGRTKGDDCYLIAHMHGGGRYETGFADRSMCVRFLDRPVFRGVGVAND